MNKDQQISPLSYDYEEKRKEFNFMKNSTHWELQINGQKAEQLEDGSFRIAQLQNAASGTKLTEGFEFIDKKEILGKDFDAIVFYVNKKHDTQKAERRARMKPLYCINDGTDEPLWRHTKSQGSLIMAYIEEYVSLPMDKTEKLPVNLEELVKARDTINRAIENGVTT